LLDGGYAPYWAFCWGAGQALARFILDNPGEVAGKRVVDFGAGSGVAGIAAARVGAKEVVAVDTDAKSRRFVELNARLNDVSVTVASKMPDQWDVMLVADVLYELPNSQWFKAFAQNGREVLVADPQRPRNPKLDIEPIARYQVTTQPDVDYPMCQAAIYRFSTTR
jgi:predicted nicotinamide N-methyase